MSDNNRDAAPKRQESERREYRRIPARLIANFHKDKPVDGVTRDISLGGVFIETHASFALGDTVSFDLLIPDKHGTNNARVTVTATVRWQQNRPPHGIGVEIDRLSVTDLQSLQTYIRRRARENESGDGEEKGGVIG